MPQKYAHKFSKLEITNLKLKKEFNPFQILADSDNMCVLKQNHQFT